MFIIANKFHISDKGEVVRCRANVTACPKENFDSFEEASSNRDRIIGSSTIPAPLSNNTAPKIVRDAEHFYGGRFVTAHRIDVPANVSSVIEDIAAIGTPLIVGGFVRDSFDGHDNKDIDIEVHGVSMDDLSNKLKKSGYTVDEVGRQFGVLKVSKKGVVSDLDISVPRRENMTGAGHRDFSVHLDEDMTVQEAAERRDFTFNAMMYDSRRGVLVDPSGGRNDLDNRIMRHVSDKFSEDPLRVLRGFQFASRFNMSYAPETAALCRDIRQDFSTLSKERVQEEWTKFFTRSVVPLQGVKALQDSGWDDTLPGLRTSLKDDRVLSALSKIPTLPKTDRSILGAASIAASMTENERKDFLPYVLMSKKESVEATTLASVEPSQLSSSYDRKLIARKLQNAGFTFDKYRTLCAMRGDRQGFKVASAAVREGLGRGSEKDLVMGADVVEVTSRKPGPWMGELLNRLRDRQYRGEFADRGEAISAMRKEISRLDG